MSSCIFLYENVWGIQKCKSYKCKGRTSLSNLTISYGTIKISSRPFSKGACWMNMCCGVAMVIMHVQNIVNGENDSTNILK